jgi:hypothetical protein
MIAALFSWTKLPQWGMELVAILLVALATAGGYWYWQHHEIDKGIADQKKTDDTASKKLEAQTAVQNAALAQKATTAKEAYDKEHEDNLAYRAAHPDGGTVQLCLAAPAHGSGALLPAAATLNRGNASSGSATANVPAVPVGNLGSGGGAIGPDISGLLGLLAQRSDQVSAVLREYQSR